MITTHKSRQ